MTIFTLLEVRKEEEEKVRKVIIFHIFTIYLESDCLSFYGSFNLGFWHL